MIIASKRREYLPALTGLRFVLAAWVMLHHISGKNMMLEQWTNGLPWYAQSLVHGGYMAVQTFFILSGFVLARTYFSAEWKRSDVLRYGAARVARVYPVYLLSLLLVSPFIIETMFKPARSGGEKAALLADYGFVLQGWTAGLNVGWNTPAWSLTCEFFFYLFFPLVFPLLRRAGWRTLSIVIGVAIVTPVLLAHGDLPRQWKPIHHFSDFVAGIAAARIYQLSRFSLRGRGGWFYLPATAVGVYVIVFPQVMRWTYGDVNTALRPLSAVALIGLALNGGILARMLSCRACDYLGKVSYSMYILHVPVLWWYSYWAMHGPIHMPMPVAAAIYFAIVTGLSAAAYKYVEMPANKWIRIRVDAWIAREPEPMLARVAA